MKLLDTETLLKYNRNELLGYIRYLHQELSKVKVVDKPDESKPDLASEAKKLEELATIFRNKKRK